MRRPAFARSIDVVAVGIGAALLSVCAFGAFAWWQQTRAADGLQELDSRHLEVSQAAWQIRWYDEVRTHSAARFVLSQGDPTWRRRYYTYVARIDDSLAQARRGAEPDAFAHLASVGDASQRLLSLEAQVFKLGDAGRYPAAAAILAGEYERQKSRYRNGLDAFFRAQSASLHAAIGAQQAAALRQRSLGVGATVFMILVLVLLGARYRSQRQLDAREREREEAAAMRDFERRLTNALDMALGEEDAFKTMTSVLRTEVPQRPAELLIADSSRAHLHVALRTDPEHRLPGCGVDSPFSCPAIRRGQVLEFGSSEQYDACPHLQGRETPCSAVCVPLNLDGRAVGVLHSIGEPEAAVSSRDRSILEESARRVGDRVGLLRAFHRSEQQARTDGLTGLLNRRSGSDAIRELVGAGHGVALAIGDLDRFKALNDTHGHDAGDRALRLFARILRDEARPDDVVARWGGEEFVVALGEATAEHAVAMLERVRLHLAGALDRGGVPAFTASFGVVDSSHSAELDELVVLADRALYRAKQLGRNRVEIAGNDELEVPVANETAAVVLVATQQDTNGSGS